MGRAFVASLFCVVLVAFLVDQVYCSGFYFREPGMGKRKQAQNVRKICKTSTVVFLVRTLNVEYKKGPNLLRKEAGLFLQILKLELTTVTKLSRERAVKVIFELSQYPQQLVSFKYYKAPVMYCVKATCWEHILRALKAEIQKWLRT